MSVTVKIPTQLRPATGGAAEVQVDGVSKLDDVLGRLRELHPELIERMTDEQGQIRRFINVYVGDEDVRFLGGLSTPVEDGAVVSILPAVAGGGPLTR